MIYKDTEKKQGYNLEMKTKDLEELRFKQTPYREEQPNFIV